MVSSHWNLQGEWKRNGHCSFLATVFYQPFPFSLKVRRSKPQRNTGCYCYHCSCNDKVHSIISLCCSCLFCRGILISVGMSDNESYIVRQEISLAAKIRGPCRDLLTTSEYETVWATGQTQGWKQEQLLCWGSEQSTTPMHLCSSHISYI